jgi:hypothetical protein
MYRVNTAKATPAPPRPAVVGRGRYQRPREPGYSAWMHHEPIAAFRCSGGSGRRGALSRRRG